MAKQVQTKEAPPTVGWDEPGVPAVSNGREMVSLSNLIAEVKDQQPEVVSRLVDVWERVRNIEREEEFNRAYAAMWPKLPQIARKGEITLKSGGGYKYVRDEDLMEEVTPLMDTHGFAYSVRAISQDLDAKPLPTLTMEGELIYKRNGFSKKNRLTGTYDRHQSRNELQALGSCQTYLIKYIIRGLLAIVQKGDDDDGKSTGGSNGQGASPPPPPRPRVRPADRPVGINEWVKTAVAAIDAEIDAGEGGRWQRFVETAYERAPTLAELNNLEAVLRCDIEHKDTPSDVRTGLAVKLLEARKRFAEEPPPGFDYPVFDAQGEIDQLGEGPHSENFTTATDWAARFMVLWGKAGRAEREAMLEHNADALQDARGTGIPGVLKLLADAVVEPEEPPPSDGMFDDTPPPEGPLDPDEAWAREQLAAIDGIPKSLNGRGVFDQIVTNIRPRMRELRTVKPDIYNRISAAFTQKHNELPGGSK